MAPSFSVATRQLDDGFESNEYATSTFQTRRGCFSSTVEFKENGFNMVDYSGVRHSETEERELIMHGESPDRYSYRRAASYLSSNYPIQTNSRMNDHPELYKNDSDRVCFDEPEWKGHGDCRGKSALPTVQEDYFQDSPSKKLFLSKPSPSYGLTHGKEYGSEDLTYQSNNRHDVQPGFQRILYDARFDSKPKSNPTMIEVSPGEYLRLRGADETWRAIHNDFYVPCSCVCCELTLFCIQDAVFVLCPECLIVSPLEGVVIDGYDGGVGIGFTMESLASWQEEIKMQVNRSDGRAV